ncbi:hypothetical protein PINS_up003879 [Pythium insidiosum]|nr:hypothetical protein PINS_up003879 [Pythium insidiosum]
MPSPPSNGLHPPSQPSPASKRTSTAALSKASSPKPVKGNTGRWTEAEHKLFLKGLEQFPYRAWKKIATLIKTRTVVQIRTHAQKYYQKLEKEEQRMREREAQLAAQQGLPSPPEVPTPSTPVAAPFPVEPTVVQQPTPEPAVQPSTNAVTCNLSDDSGCGNGKKRAIFRKRKSSTDEGSPQSSLPKRMMKEKKVTRERTMSPKQKVVTSSSRIFGFNGPDNLDASTVKSNVLPPRAIAGLNSNPLELDDTTSTVSLEFPDDKATVDYSFALDATLDQGIAGLDHEELLQLSDDESLDWFATTNDASDADNLEGALPKPSPVSSPLNLGRFPFPPLCPDEPLDFEEPMVDSATSSAVASECSTPSPVLSSAADCSDFGLSGDDDEDFVLDPDKFLSSYLNPDLPKEQ